MSTFNNIAYMALRLSGQLAPGSTASPEMIADALQMANSMLNSWNADRLTIYKIDDQLFTIAASTQSYTIGTGLTFDPGYNPARVVDANLVLLSNVSQPTRIPIQILQQPEWAAIPVINVSSQVTIQAYFEKLAAGLKMYCFPFPTTGNQFEFFMWRALTRFAAATDTFTFPEGYEDAIMYGLAERMWPLGSKHLNGGFQGLENLRRNAAGAKRTIEKFNAPTYTLGPDFTSRQNSDGGAPFDYLTGDFST